MSVPRAIFIDTSIFDGQNYNFSSTAFSTFIEAVKGKDLALLIPDPTRREINRHIKAKSDAVIHALEEAKRQAPFLEKWKEWPFKKNLSWTVPHQLRELAMKELHEFLSHFQVKELSYDHVNIRQIMDWYERTRAPFSEKKRKEFPDAFSLAAILAYASTSKESVAIVSADKDFKAACDLYTELLHYGSLAAITEALLSSDRRLGQAKELLKGDGGSLHESVREAFTYLGFYPESDPSGDVEDVEIHDVSFTDFKVVHIGEAGFSTAFEAEIDYSAQVRCRDDDWPRRVYKGIVAESVVITGVAKLDVSDDWASLTGVGAVDLDVTDIAVTERPGRYEREYEPDDDYPEIDDD